MKAEPGCFQRYLSPSAFGIHTGAASSGESDLQIISGSISEQVQGDVGRREKKAPPNQIPRSDKKRLVKSASDASISQTLGLLDEAQVEDAETQPGQRRSKGYCS